MSTTIQQTVQTALSQQGLNGYARQAEPVIALLVNRERDISERLIDYAGDLGADTREVRQQLSGLGMAVPEPEPEDDDDEDTTADSAAIGRIEQMLTAMGRQIDSLTDFARRNGYRG